jgi:hypothetical protein
MTRMVPLISARFPAAAESPMRSGFSIASMTLVLQRNTRQHERPAHSTLQCCAAPEVLSPHQQKIIGTGRQKCHW